MARFLHKYRYVHEPRTNHDGLDSEEDKDAGDSILSDSTDNSFDIKQ